MHNSIGEKCVYRETMTAQGLTNFFTNLNNVRKNFCCLSE